MEESQESDQVLSRVSIEQPPKEWLDLWHKLSIKEQQDVQQSAKFMDGLTLSTVKLQSKDPSSFSIQVRSKPNPFEYKAPSTLSVASPSSPRREDEVKAVIEMIEHHMNIKSPQGIILDKNKVSSKRKHADGDQVDLVDEVGFEHVRKVLGEGHSAGKVLLVKDRCTQAEMALKTIMISQFKREEVLAWIALGDEGLAPKLYHFQLDRGTKVVFTMEVMHGKTLEDVADELMKKVKEEDLVQNFSLCILSDLLEIWEKLKAAGYAHGDMHAGNVFLEDSTELKLFDFGLTQSLMNSGTDAALIKKDLVGIIRVFCLLYSGYGFEDMFQAMRVLTAGSLKELNEYMCKISEEQREEMYSIITMLFNTVTNPHSSHYGDTSTVAKTINERIASLGGKTTIKKKVAAIVFPEKYQHTTEADSGVAPEGDVVEDPDADPIWDDINMAEYEANVSDRDLLKLDGV